MEATLKVRLRPFQTPNAVLVEEKPKPRENGLETCTSIPLSELDSMTLSRLCNQFRADVFKKAGKEQPAELAPCFQPQIRRQDSEDR